MLTVNRISSLLMLAVAIAFGTQLRGVPELDAMFPKWVLGAIVAMCIGVLLMTLRKGAPDRAFKVPNLRVLGPAVGLMVLWLILIPVVGFYVASVVSFALLMAFIDGAAREPRVLVSSVAIIAVEIGLFYVVFANLLDVPLPKGILF